MWQVENKKGNESLQHCIANPWNSLLLYVGDIKSSKSNYVKSWTRNPSSIIRYKDTTAGLESENGSRKYHYMLALHLCAFAFLPYFSLCSLNFPNAHFQRQYWARGTFNPTRHTGSYLEAPHFPDISSHLFFSCIYNWTVKHLKFQKVKSVVCLLLSQHTWKLLLTC